jgi:hypothetical protein
MIVVVMGQQNGFGCQWFFDGGQYGAASPGSTMRQRPFSSLRTQM